MSLRHQAEAYFGLLKRYRQIFSYYWQQRKELSGPRFHEFEAEFLPAALSLQAAPVSPVGRWVARILMLLIATLLAWSILGKIDIVVNATGKIIPSAYTKSIASVDVASVQVIHVQEGQQVKKGDVLIELDASETDAERDKAFEDKGEALLQVERSRALLRAVDSGKLQHLANIAGIPPEKLMAAQAHLDGDYADFRAKLQRIDSQIIHYHEALPLATQRAQDYFELQKAHDVAPHAYMEKEQARIDLQAQLTDAINQRIALIAETKKDAYDQLTQGEKQAADSGKDELRAGSHSRLLKLISPVDGTVQQLKVHTIGGVVAAAQPLMDIVPKENVVEVEATLENKDIGFVEEGQPAEIKVNAFEYTKYGTVAGKLVHVSRDAVEDDKKNLIYTGKISLDQSSMNIDGHMMPLTAGMSVNVDIKTGTRRIIEYVLSPLMQHGNESLHER